MRMTDVSVQDDCYIETVTPSKKKKMKQAQLPFQMLISLETPNCISTKKRKLTSPAVECKSPKVVRMSKENSPEVIKQEQLSTEPICTLNESKDDIQVAADTEIEVDEGTAQFDETKIANDVGTPKRVSVGKSKKLFNSSKRKSSPLLKFVKKSKKEAEITIEDKENSSEREEEADTPYDKSSSVESFKIVSQFTNTSATQVEDTSTLAGNDSLCLNSDSDIVILSSESEGKDEDEKSNEKLQKNLKADSIKTPGKTLKAETNAERMQNKKITPKQQEKKLLSAKKREERGRMKMEKEKKLEEERENRRKEKEEKRKEKEEKDKAEKEQRMQEKKQKELRIQQKQKEKEAKEEERRKKEEVREEEKRKKEEEKLEAERKKQKAVSSFARFFVAKKQGTKSTEDEIVVAATNFMPFEVKADMKVAPVCRRFLNRQEKLSLDQKCTTENTRTSELYLNEIRSKKHIPRKSTKTWPLEAKDDIVILEEENEGTSNIVDQNIAVEQRRPKLLQFDENRRPPYWGTWRKHSRSINPRRPFATDSKWFNYEVDSDEEWEEEEPGESIRGSDDEKEEESPEDNEYDVDNEFMVPHGYLSDEEARADEEDKEDMTPETQEFKLKVLGDLFETERNTKTSKLKPKIIGCIWQKSGNTYSENVPARIIDFLSAHQAWVRQIPVVLSTSPENDAAVGECGTPTKQQSQTSSKKTKVPAEALPDLIRLVHGNTHGRRFLVKEFMTYWNKRNKVGENPISKASLLQKIREIGTWMACPEVGPMHLKACWYIAEEKRKEYLMEELTLPNRWSYILTPKRKSELSEAADRVEKEEKDKEKKCVPLITQFTKKITQEEMKKQLAVKPDSTALSKTQQKARKRATLISVGIGEQFSKTSKDSLLKCFVSVGKTEKADSSKSEDHADVIIYDVEEEENCTNNQTDAAAKSNEKEENVDRLGSNFSTENKSESKKVKSGDQNSTSRKYVKSGNETVNLVALDEESGCKEHTNETVDTSMGVEELESNEK